MVYFSISLQLFFNRKYYTAETGNAQDFFNGRIKNSKQSLIFPCVYGILCLPKIKYWSQRRKTP